MNEYSKVLLEKIQRYMDKEISKDELGEWSKYEYYKLLTGDYIYIDKLITYKFLKKLSEFHIEKDEIKDEYPTTLDEIKEIQGILQGKIDTIITGSIRIFPKYLEKHLGNKEVLKIISCKRNVQNTLGNKEKMQVYFDQLTEIFQKKRTSPITIINFLEGFVLELIENLSTVSNGVSSSNFSLYLRKEDRSEEKRTDKLLDLLACILGEKSFEVSIMYNQGIPYLSALV
ncbi:hypothetical protein [Enterococcus sp. LJL51]|uniref:hypothetical protein n=1 Tax=Enterococcus sp. LJL51 TaxID=3416656 RepID=UPI003CF1C616